jgi:hypothetical protein
LKNVGKYQAESGFGPQMQKKKGSQNNKPCTVSLELPADCW